MIPWPKSTGPTSGMSASRGIESPPNRSEAFSSAGSSLTMNAVRPLANTIRTTPTMIWSAWNFTDSQPRMLPSSSEAMIAAASPSTGPPMAEKTTAASAPMSSWPSMAMLITPARSHMAPHSAPRVRGTACRTATRNSSTRLRLPSAAAHVRNASTNSSAPTASVPTARPRVPRVAWSSPRAASATPIVTTVGTTGRVNGGTSTTGLRPFKVNVAVPAVPVKNASVTAASSSWKMPKARSRGSPRSWRSTVTAAITHPTLLRRPWWPRWSP